jgi:hypothetical protein
VTTGERAARRAAAEVVLAQSRAEDNARTAVADMQRAAFEVMRAEVGADRLDELDRFLQTYCDPEGPAVTAYLDGLRGAFTQFCVENCTLGELEDFARFQHSERFQALSDALTATVKAPLKAYQINLVHEINARFRSS